MSNHDALDNNKTDGLVIAVKGVTGLIPYAGSIIAEIVGSLIPNQRQERIVSFIRMLNERTIQLEQTLIRIKMTSPEFIDLFEDGAMQAVKAISEQRREQIAALLVNSLSQDELDYLKAKLLLNLLGELSDVEVIILKFYSLSSKPEKQNVFADKHKEVLHIIPVTINDLQEEVDINTLHKSYREHLVRLGLLLPNYKKPKKGEFPEFDIKTGSIKSSGYKITPLGRLLVRWVE